MDTLPTQNNPFAHPCFSISVDPIRQSLTPTSSALDFVITFNFQATTTSIALGSGDDWTVFLHPLVYSALGDIDIVYPPGFRSEVTWALESRLRALTTRFSLSSETSQVYIAVNIELVDESWYGYPSQDDTTFERYYGVQDPYDIDDDDYYHGYEVFYEEVEETEATSSFEVALQNLHRVTSIDERVSMVGEDCPVCLNELVTVIGTDDNDSKDQDKDGVVVRLPCKHVFHESCITSWFKKNTRCPMCRFSC